VRDRASSKDCSKRVRVSFPLLYNSRIEAKVCESIESPSLSESTNSLTISGPDLMTESSGIIGCSRGLAEVNTGITISFPEDYNFSDRSIKLLQGTIGIYFIYLVDLRIPYPFGQSRLIYIGMSESKQNSIGRRLLAHLSGQSGNHGIRNYADHHKTKFTYHSYELLRDLGTANLFEIESFFLGDFLRAKGSFPICNNQSGVLVIEPLMKHGQISVDWEHFS